MRAVLALIFVTACAAETARPARLAPRVEAKPSSLPLPDTAFQADDTTTEPEPFDRFATRRIGASAPEGPRYRGPLVDLDLRGADVRDVFRLLADVGKVNLVVPDDVSGTVTMRLRRVPWDQALDVIARSRGLGWEREGNLIVVRREIR